MKIMPTVIASMVFQPSATPGPGGSPGSKGGAQDIILFPDDDGSTDTVIFPRADDVGKDYVIKFPR